MGKSRTLKVLASILAAMLCMSGASIVFDNLVPAMAENGGGGGGDSETGGGNKVKTAPRRYVFDNKKDGKYVQGVRQDSIDYFWENSGISSTGDKDLYESAAKEAIKSAEDRAKKGGMENPKARVVAVGWVINTETGAFAKKYQPGIHNDLDWPSIRYILPTPEDDPDLWKKLRPNEAWVAECHAYGAKKGENWIDYLYRVGVRDRPVWDDYFGSDLSCLVLAVVSGQPDDGTPITLAKRDIGQKPDASARDVEIYNAIKNNPLYDLTGAEFTLYDTNGKTVKMPTISSTGKEGAAKTVVFRSDSDGATGAFKISDGTYYIKETKAPNKGYLKDTDGDGIPDVKDTSEGAGVKLEISSGTVKVNGTEVSVSKKFGSVKAFCVDWYDPPETGSVKVQKVPSNAWFLSAKTYGLSGAEYQVIDFTGKVWGTNLKTNTYGISQQSVDLPLGTYILKEIVPPPGYRITITPTKVTVVSSAPTIGRVSDNGDGHPGVSFGAKKDLDLDLLDKGYNPQAGATLAQAKYKLSYYDGYYTSPSALPKAAHTVSEMTTVLVNGKALLDFTADNMVFNGAEYVLPLGTYTLQEIQAPSGYMLDPTIHMFRCEKKNAAVGLYVARDANGTYFGQTENSKDARIDANNRLKSVEQIKRGDFSLMKYIELPQDTDDHKEVKVPCEGVKFHIINNNDFRVMRVDTGEWIDKGDIVYTITTDEDGYASTKRERGANGWTGIENNFDPCDQAPCALAYGSYILREDPATTPEGYKPIEEYPFNISENFDYPHQIFENKTGTVIRVFKVDSDSQSAVRGHAKVEILREDMSVMIFKDRYPSNTQISVLTTGIDGSVVLPQKLESGKYFIREVQAPEGYLHSTELVPFTVDETTINTYDDPKDVNFPDESAKGKFILTKKDSETGGIITAADATYEIYANEDITTQDGTVHHRKDELVDTITTQNGVATSKELNIGRYRAVEVKAPTGYLVNKEPINFEIAYEGDKKGIEDKLVYTRVDDFDVPVKGHVNVLKSDRETKRPVSLYTATFEVRAAENIVGGDGHLWHTKGEVVDIISTDNGYAQSKLLHLGKYELVEVVAPDTYVLDETPVPVELLYADQNTAIVSVLGEKEDAPSEIELLLTKTDCETGAKVWTAGCEIGIYASEDVIRGDGSIKWAKDTEIGRVKTDESGEIITDLKLRCGRYYLRELSAPAGYLLDSDTIYEVEALWDGGISMSSICKASISDNPAKGVIAFTKADAETGNTIAAAGIKAEVFANEDIKTGDGTIRYHKDEKVAELSTNEEGFAESGELYLGNYRIVETFAPAGYLLNTTPVNVSLVYANQNVPVVFSSAQIADKNAKGIIKIVKMDKETGQVVPVAGTTFEVRAKTDIITGDGTVRVKAGELACPPVSTDESGKGQTPPLYIGIYTITETVAPAGYTLDATPHDAVVAYKDQHTAIVFSTESIANTAQKGVIEVEKQDAESGLPVLMSDAAFEVSAAEDIITPDGTLRACAGDIVDTIETDETGHAHTKALYLGKYTVREISAPAGYILTDEVKEVELVYGDQTEPVVYSSTFLANMPVKGVVSIHKEDGAQNIPLADVEYELRAAENIITGDDTVHHKAGDVVAILKTDKNGNASVGGIYLGEYVLVETVQPDGYELDEKEYPVHLEYAGQDVPEVSFENTFYNTPASVVIKKVSTSDDSLVVPDTKFVGWLADNEVALDEPFAVFADKDIDIVSASIEYLGEFSTSNIDVVEDTFELSVKEVEGAYTVLVADKKPAQGDYTLHLTYRNDRQDRDVSVPFVINEYDANAYFAIGQDIVIDDADDETASSFARIRDMKAAYDAGLGGGHGDADDGDDNSEDNGSAGNENDNAGEDNLPEDRPDSVVVGDTANVVSPLVALEEGTDEGEGVVDGDNEAETETPDGTPDDTEELPDGDMPNAGDDENNDTDIEDTKCEVSISRVPAVLSKGGFALSCTDDKGIATFTYVLQGKVAFAEYEPAAGYVSDRTPGYVEIGSKGVVDNTQVEGNVYVPQDSDKKDSKGNIIELDMVFADDQTKLHISKKDITTSEELPGNTLSVYKYAGGGTSDEVGEGDYGELLDTWVSTDKPHYMELLPQGTYILKEEQAVDGYTVAESIIFRLNDTGVEQHVLMNNEHEAVLADELVELVETGDGSSLWLAVMTTIVISAAGIVWYRRRHKRFFS